MVWKIKINCQVLLNFSVFRQKKIELWVFHLFSCNIDNDFSRGFSKTNNTFIFAASLNADYVKKKKKCCLPTLCSVILCLGVATPATDRYVIFLTKRNHWHLILGWKFLCIYLLRNPHSTHSWKYCIIERNVFGSLKIHREFGQSAFVSKFRFFSILYTNFLVVYL